ncbi:response regulator transcription factor [Planosporangium thailandense]|uniref:Response regulator transcription factor n=1 Tax=Planosporangium thailandense TaxID=765197 RepID=A0ABX0Y5V4_9ACTN|nr:response regulator transcription factor [Planosporangium thailandense]
MAQILLVEDDAEIRRALIRALTDRGHVVSSAATAMAGLQSALDGPVDIVVLDLGLPDVDGREALRMLRSVSQVPVIVATARDDERMMVDVLDRGADDYLVKPFGPAQLDARIRAVLRRAGGEGAEPAAQVLVVGDLRVDPASREATLSGVPLELTPREFDLLCYLSARPGAVVSKRELLAQVWRLPFGGADKTVDVHLSWLRRKLGETAIEPRYLHTIRGVGVKLVAPAPPA